ncbi:MAG: class I SAM-dependent methyltransferase [Pseudomonadota bacterium]
MSRTLDLPLPSPDEAAHSARLSALLREEISRVGALDFARYMERVLYAPGLGYYSAGRTKFGAAGDFVTAPELGAVFARCVARALAPALGAGRCFLEIGAGSGAFAAAALAEWARLDTLPDEYLVLETSADLRQRQATTLAARAPALAARVRWLDAPPAAPWRGALFANEVVDALPVRMFCWRGAQGLFARAVDAAPDGGLRFVERAADPGLWAAFGRAIEDPDALPVPYVSEVLPRLPEWFAAVAGALAEGVALFIDYGYPRREYYLPQRAMGTLVCHYRHRAHADPLWMPGLCDLTAFVDFTALAEAGYAAGFVPACYASPARFLLAAGLAEIADTGAVADAVARLSLAQEIRTLTLPGEMGERFKALAFLRGFDAARLPWLAIDEGFRL